MKIHRITSLLCYGVIAFIIVSIAWAFLFTGGHSGMGGVGYGNIRTFHSWEDRGILEPRVNWLIVTPHKVIHQEYNRGSGITYRFENGREYTFDPDRKNLIWVDAETGPEKISTKLTKSLIERIRERSSENSAQFTSPEEFLASLKSK